MLFSRQESNAASGSRAITICSGLVGDPKPAWVIIKQIENKGYSCSKDKLFCHFLGKAPGGGFGVWILYPKGISWATTSSLQLSLRDMKSKPTWDELQSQSKWLGHVGSPCPLNFGVQDLVTELPWTTLRGTRGAREGKKQRLVKVSQLFLSETVGEEFEGVLTDTEVNL